MRRNEWESGIIASFLENGLEHRDSAYHTMKRSGIVTRLRCGISMNASEMKRSSWKRRARILERMRFSNGITREITPLVSWNIILWRYLTYTRCKNNLPSKLPCEKIPRMQPRLPLRERLHETVNWSRYKNSNWTINNIRLLEKKKELKIPLRTMIGKFCLCGIYLIVSRGLTCYVLPGITERLCITRPPV